MTQIKVYNYKNMDYLYFDLDDDCKIKVVYDYFETLFNKKIYLWHSSEVLNENTQICEINSEIYLFEEI